ncbi:MAG: recombination protein O N-terminal domain-containing protein, partial [Alphaproteobacteria bacterium]|nr:recombination protein O N-terminal domain-containing protein [Alphaproteobacteria bacterium]
MPPAEVFLPDEQGSGSLEWRDQGALLNVRRHGETSAIIEVFT